jgi:DNA adenine methylase
MLSTYQNNKKVRIPNLVKWAGGKGNFIETLTQHIPKEFKTYYEPFFGGGSLFWNLKLQGRIGKAIISDANPDLINLLLVVRDRFQDLYDELRNYIRLNQKYQYYNIRREFNLTKNNSELCVERAAMFLYLNRNAYNALWRTNMDGEFNVPYGYYKNYWLPSLDNLNKYSILLKDTKIINADFSKALTNCKQGDFVYLDPPYYNELKYGFTKYCSGNFNVYDHERLKEIMDNLNMKGVFLLETNYDTDFTKKLYTDYRQLTINVRHNISCKPSSRMKYRELIITNYEMSFPGQISIKEQFK